MALSVFDRSRSTRTAVFLRIAAGSTLGVGGVFIAALLPLLLAGCSTGTGFEEYDGTNLIEARGFDSGEWYFAAGLDQESDASAPYDYVEFEEVSSAVYGSLPSGANGPVYRLEVVNLFTDGTFEDATPDVVPDTLTWLDEEFDPDPPNNSAQPLIVDDTPIGGRPASINGQSLHINATAAEARLAVELGSALLDGNFNSDELYAYHLDFRTGIQTFAVELNDNINIPNVQASRRISRGEPLSDSIVYAFSGSNGENPDLVDSISDGSNLIDQDMGGGYLSFGGLNSKARGFTTRITVDNIRFVRADQNHLLRLPVPYEEAGRPPLISGGSYTVRFWARNDPTAGGASAPNRIPARFLSAGIDTRIGSPIEVSKTLAATATRRTYVGDLTDWQRFEFSVPGNSITIGSGTASDETVLDIVIEIGHSSAGSYFRDAGSILLTDPELEWDESTL